MQTVEKYSLGELLVLALELGFIRDFEIRLEDVWVKGCSFEVGFTHRQARAFLKGLFYGWEAPRSSLLVSR